MERTESRYSIVRYSPDSHRGEIINIGVILHVPLNNKIYYRIIDQNNLKIKSLLVNKNQLELYKVHHDFLDFYLNKAIKNDDLFLTSDLFYTLNSNMPKQIQLTESTYSITSEPEALLNTLLSTYIGDEFLETNDQSSIKVRTYVRTEFKNRNLLGTKIEANAKIYPFPDKNLINLNVDFVYKNGVVNLMQTIPTKDNMKNWFTKLYSFMDTFDKSSVYKVLIDSKSELMQDATFLEMVEFLRTKATPERFQTIDINSPEFIELCLKIEADGKPLDSFRHELIM